ncbi:MAG TPA: hypothetical protein VLG50_05670 [Candidatus Saccharimonadales bacterium]|nr:hypothetical protein [Candidatus Saccharimonadales bacterium]
MDTDDLVEKYPDLFTKSYAHYIQLMILTHVNKPYGKLERWCSFCNDMNNYTYYFDDVFFHALDRYRYRYFVCPKTWYDVYDFYLKIPLFKLGMQSYLVNDVIKYICQLIIIDMNTWVPTCILLKQKLHDERVSYVNIKIGSQTIKQLENIIIKRGLMCPNNAKKKVYQCIILNDIAQKKREWML